MKTSFSGWLHRARLPLILACATYPLVFAAGMGLGSMGALLALTVAYGLLAEICLLLPGRRRLLGGAICSAALLGLGAALLPVTEKPLLLAVPAGYALLLMAGLPMAAWPQDREPHMAWPLLGLGGYVVLLELLQGPWRGRVEGARLLPLGIGFVILLALALLIMSRASVRDATAGRVKAPTRVRRMNTLMTLGYLALGLSLAMLPGIVRALRVLWQGVKRLIFAVASWLMSLMPPMTGGTENLAAPSPEAFTLVAEQAEPGPLQIMLGRILAIIAFVALALLAFMLLRAVYRGLKRLARAILARLMRFSVSVAEDYVDEVTDTREEGGEARRMSPWRARMGLGGEGRLPPRERVRHRYLRLKWKHGEWRGGMTARETIPEAPAAIYERARYSDHEVTEEDARAFLDGVRRV